MTPETPERALQRLLHDLFDAEELRGFLRQLDDGGRLERALAGKAASAELLVSDAVGALRRRGAVDDAFFAALIEERPRKAARIREVQAIWAAASAEGAVESASGQSLGGSTQTVINHGAVGQQINVQGGGHVFHLGKGRG